MMPSASLSSRHIAASAAPSIERVLERVRERPDQVARLSRRRRAALSQLQVPVSAVLGVGEQPALLAVEAAGALVVPV